MTAFGWALAVHGGAGWIPRGRLTAEQARAYRQALGEALETGASVLAGGGRALEAAEAAVCVLEDNPLFNAGRGAAFTAEGRNELDAAIMDGATLAAGAVAAVTATRNPIQLARAVMERSPHVLLVGDGADRFSREAGLAQAGPEYFATLRRWESLIAELGAAGRPQPAERLAPGGARDPLERLVHDEGKRGTVGAVARDRDGHLAAAGSTGGITGKLWGRVGDTALIGAGVHAADEGCAVACTGTGEHFIRLSVAKRISDLVALGGLEPQAACDRVIRGELGDIGGEGGALAVGRAGPPVWSFNTEGMFRARRTQSGLREIKLHAQDVFATIA